MSAKTPEKQLTERPFLEDLDEAVYTVAEVLAMTEVLAEQGISIAASLEGTGISRRTLQDPHARISARQRLAAYRNALRLSPDSGVGLDVGTRLNTDLTTAEIAERAGFSDSANFRSAFKRWRKLTPTEYRSQVANRGVDISDFSISAPHAPARAAAGP